MTAPELVPQYYLRPVSGSFGWAVITMNERIGMLQITSDWGNWSYRWSAPGMPFKEFCIQMERDPDYLIGKLTQDIRQYRSAKKQEAWMEQACRDFFDHVYAPVFVPLLRAELTTGGCGVTTVPIPLSLRAETGRRYAPRSATAPISASDPTIPEAAPQVEPAPELGTTCPECHGLGHFNDRDLGRCLRCSGSGMLPS